MNLLKNDRFECCSKVFCSEVFTYIIKPRFRDFESGNEVGIGPLHRELINLLHDEQLTAMWKNFMGNFEFGDDACVPASKLPGIDRFRPYDASMTLLNIFIQIGWLATG